MIWAANIPEPWDGGAAIILSHGAGQGMQSPFMKYFHAELRNRGFLSVMFNFEYMDKGRKIPDPQPKMQALYRQVITEVISRYRPRFLLIGGKSMGGRVASYIAQDTPGVHGMIFLGYPLHPPGKVDQMRDAHLYELHAPMLFLSGSRDPFARRDLLEGVVQRLGDRATLVWTEGGDHSLRVTRKGNEPLRVASDHIEEWVRRTVMG
jgi:predicted alpha/beta-hydrolase family hydrolase